MENINTSGQNKIIKEALGYREYSSKYSDELQFEAAKIEVLPLNSTIYKIFIKKLILSENLKFEEVKDKLPEPALVNADEILVRKMNHIFGTDYEPISYQIIKSLILTGKTDEFNEELYYATPDEPIKAPFQLGELINTTPYVKKRKNQKKY